MKQEKRVEEARDIMIRFADQTGLSSNQHPPRRYLWTDAFAVCNFLSLFRLTGEEKYRHLALDLIDQVHDILGRHRDDDPRTGWISGLDEEQGATHPTAGGLRIGKKLNERAPDEPIDERLEWDRDGQYFHYLTKWMHALERAGRITGERKYCRWAVELAQAAYKGFIYAPLPGHKKRMVWKMSIDLSWPLVASMGHHDPLDGFVTCQELRNCEKKAPHKAVLPNLDPEIDELACMCKGINWDTTDPLGIGGLLFDAGRIMQLTVKEGFRDPHMLEALLRSAQYGLESFVKNRPLNDLADRRLAFRELGLSIGLKAVAKMREFAKDNSQLFNERLSEQIDSLMQFVPLCGYLEDFWRSPVHQQAESWQAHRDINLVMLATSLLPDEFLSL